MKNLKSHFRCALASFFVCFYVFSPLAAQSARFSGSYLLQVCGVDEQGNELTPGGHIACQAYIAGILDYHNLIRSLGAAPAVDFCVPDGADLNEVQARISRYLAENRHEQGPFIAAPGVALGLFESYPCKK